MPQSHTIWHVVTPSGTVTFYGDNAERDAIEFQGKGDTSVWSMLCSSEITEESMEVLASLDIEQDGGLAMAAEHERRLEWEGTPGVTVPYWKDGGR